jgi:hypothetical protein
MAAIMEKIYLQGGPLDGKHGEVGEGDIVHYSEAPDHARYEDGGTRNEAGERIFAYRPREDVDIPVKDEIGVEPDVNPGIA